MSSSFKTFLLIIALTMDLFLLSRFDRAYSINAEGVHFGAAFLSSFGIQIILFFDVIARYSIRHRVNYRKNDYGISPLFLILLMAIGLLSSSMNGTNIIKGLCSTLIIVGPMLYIFIIPAINIKQNDIYLLLEIVMIYGVFIAMLTIGASLKPGIFERIFEIHKLGEGGRSKDIYAIRLPFGGVNGIGVVLMTLLPLYHLKALQVRNIWRRCLLTTAIIIICIGILLTVNRSTTFMLAIYVLVSLLWEIRNKLKKNIIIVLLSIMSIIIVISSYDFSRFKSLESESRFLSWYAALNFCLKNPLLGSGPDNIYDRETMDDIFSGSHPEGVHYIIRDYEKTLTDPHSDFFMVSVEYGVFGLLIFCGFLYRISKIIFDYRTKINQRGKYILNGMIIGIAFFLVLCCLGCFLTVNSRIATFFWIYVGIGLSLIRNRKLIENSGLLGNTSMKLFKQDKIS